MSHDHDENTNRNYIFLEQIRDYIYKDVVLADTKAGISLTIVAVSLAVCSALLDKIPLVKNEWRLTVDILWMLGLLSALISTFCSMLTLLPRSYISHELADNLDSWVHVKTGFYGSMKRRFLDAFYVIFENIWQKQAKGTTQSLQLLMKSNDEEKMVGSLYDAMNRALLVQNLKFLWAGKSLIFAFIAFSLVGSATILAIEYAK